MPLLTNERPMPRACEFCYTWDDMRLPSPGAQADPCLLDLGAPPRPCPLVICRGRGAFSLTSPKGCRPLLDLLYLLYLKERESTRVAPPPAVSGNSLATARRVAEVERSRRRRLSPWAVSGNHSSTFANGKVQGRGRSRRKRARPFRAARLPHAWKECISPLHVACTPRRSLPWASPAGEQAHG